jgi:hypothetical protein
LTGGRLYEDVWTGNAVLLNEVLDCQIGSFAGLENCRDRRGSVF